MEFSLYCGAEDPLGDTYDEGKPFQPHILPIPFEPPNPPSKKRKRSTGCGSNFHWRAIVSPTNMWRAGEMRFSREIIPLEECYFSEDMLRTLMIGESSCGCLRKGVGCAICGNPLGGLYTPCASHQTSKKGENYYAFLPSTVSPPIPPFRLPSTPPPLPPISLFQPPPPPDNRHRHPTSPPPPPMIYAYFTPTPSPEVLPVALPSDVVTARWDAVLAAGDEADTNRDEEWIWTVPPSGDAAGWYPLGGTRTPPGEENNGV
ncbi:hypothetical protein DFH09DRAFT_1186056 [Mycena vulgaris]|nr:hypothetical protein DFH09DRAFT_1186056 [Mycena vulgaris]